MLDYKYNAPNKVSFYTYRVNKNGTNIFGKMKFNTKVKTINEAIKEAEDVKKSLIKQYKTKKVYVMKEMETIWAKI
jgi:hypothetical protein